MMGNRAKSKKVSGDHSHTPDVSHEAGWSNGTIGEKVTILRIMTACPAHNPGRYEWNGISVNVAA